ncbi:IQ motif, EF-hand binding site [Artemisia annua]|uniref:IQ motif, EF-hand binding site n=1 Tax=Artemisia annua TaxID=35608 RepID=A0A2U1NPN7_ARTAN|nr:IQ motif, EF-hand binding site [Artemisia annua]
MGKKGGWFSAVRKTFVSSNNDSKDKKDKKPQKTVSKKSWFGKQKSVEADSSQSESAFATPALRSPPLEPEKDVKFAEPEASKTTELKNEPSKEREPENEPSKPIKPEVEQKNPVKQDNEPIKPSYSMAYATARAAVAAAAFRRFLGKSKEEVAAIKVQTAFRRFLARRKLRGLKGVVRLRVLVQSQSVKRQAITTLRCMQTLARVQSQVRTRRIRMSEENQALQRQLMQKREREFDNMRSSLGGEWDNTRRSKEQIEASMQNKEEAAARRERALTYAQTQQQIWRNQTKSANPTFMDPNNPHWGWSWLDRWMAARPWESQNPLDNEQQQQPLKITRSSSVGDVSQKLERSPSMSSPRTPSSTRRVASSSPRSINDPTASPRNRRHSISNSSLSEERVSSPRVSSQRVSSPRSTKTKSMIPTPTQTRSPSRSPSPSPLGMAKKGAPEKKSSVGSVKKRLSLSGAASAGTAARRLSGSSKAGGPGSR